MWFSQKHFFGCSAPEIFYSERNFLKSYAARVILRRERGKLSGRLAPQPI